MKAEDRFRLQRDRKSKCIWSCRKTRDITKPSARLFKHRKLVNRFDSHYASLCKTFEESKLLQLKTDPEKGFSICAKSHLKKSGKDSKEVSSLIWGVAQKTQSCNNYFSFILSNETCCVKGKGVKKLYQKKGKVSTGKTRNIFRPLIGPMSFINHACKKHANVNFLRRIRRSFYRRITRSTRS